MRYLFGAMLGLLLVTQTTLAKKPWSNHWKYGRIVLNSGEQFRGHLQFNLENNIVVFQSDNRVLAFSAYNVSFFTAMDTTTGFTQHFYTLPYTKSAARPRLMFFQLVYEGSFALLVREREISAEAARTTKFPVRLHPEKANTALAQDYYVFLSNGRLQEFKAGGQNIAELLSLKPEAARAVNGYISSQDIDLKRQPDIIRLIDHFVDYESIASR